MLAPRLRDDVVAHHRVRDELYVMWGAAQYEANEAYEAWREERTRDAYAVFLAAEDRADAAARELALACERPPVL